MRTLICCALAIALWSAPPAANAAPACFASPLPKLATVATGNANLLALPPQSDLREVAYSGAIDSGTVAYVGIVAPAFNHRGGAIQFWFPREPIYTKDVAPPVGVAK
jgi:hypothetical protein